MNNYKIMDASAFPPKCHRVGQWPDICGALLLCRKFDRNAPAMRVVSFGQIVVFSTASGDAWLLDASEHLAARLARDGDPEPIEIEATETTFSIAP